MPDGPATRQVQYDLVRRNGLVTGQVGRHAADRVVRGRDQNEFGVASRVAGSLPPEQPDRTSGLRERQRQPPTHAARADDGNRVERAHGSLPLTSHAGRIEEESSRPEPAGEVLESL